MGDAFITPAVVKWARGRNRWSPKELADRVGVKEDVVEAWEQGVHPTFRKAKVLAAKLRIPFGYLFLSSPPSDDLPLRDLRTVAGEPPQTPSPDFLDLLNDVLAKQQWYREYLQDDKADPIPFIGRFNITEEPERIADDMRLTLGINDELRRQTGTWEDFLTQFMRKAEDMGVLIMRSGVVENNNYRKLNVLEFRGFAISDALAPLVFLNGNDAKAAQIFTLAHELAHLWIGVSGISNPDYRRTTSEHVDETEQRCNKAAAEALVPGNDFLLRWRPNNSIADNLQMLAQYYRVSRLVVLRRAFDLGMVDQAAFWSHYDQLESYVATPTSDGGGNFFSTLLMRSSRRFTIALMTSVLEGRTPHREASSLLNVKVGTLTGIADHLFNR